MYAFNYFESDKEMRSELNAFMKEAPGKSCFLDVGALYGLFSIAFLETNQPLGRVYSFEPSPKCQDDLLGNRKLADEKRWTHIPKAVGENDGNLSMKYEWNHLVSTGTSENLENESVNIPMTSLDKLCLQEGITPDLIKIDVEGFEWHVISGARNVLEKVRPVIFMELHGEWISQHGASSDDIVNRLHQLNYQLFDLNFNLLVNPFKFCNAFGARIIAKPT